MQSPCDIRGQLMGKYLGGGSTACEARFYQYDWSTASTLSSQLRHPASPPLLYITISASRCYSSYILLLRALKRNPPSTCTSPEYRNHGASA